jgi:hypothetical protein
MPTCAPLALILLLGAPSAATAQKQGRAQAALVLAGRGDSSLNRGATFAPRKSIGFAVPPLATVDETTFGLRTARVEKDLLQFQPVLLGIPPAIGARGGELMAETPARPAPRFSRAAEAAEGLELRRDRDRLLLFRGSEPPGAAVGLGLTMFGVATFLSARAPRPFRLAFDGPVHLGPAMLDGGGMGAGIAGRGF